MRTRYRHWHRRLIMISASGLLLASGCGLSDFQLATIWQSVITSGLSTLVTGVLSNAFGIQDTTGTTTGV